MKVEWSKLVRQFTLAGPESDITNQLRLALESSALVAPMDDVLVFSYTFDISETCREATVYY
jgi:hypothetical protein